jgi:hypothetical protein
MKCPLLDPRRKEPCWKCVSHPEWEERPEQDTPLIEKCQNVRCPAAKLDTRDEDNLPQGCSLVLVELDMADVELMQE